MLCSNCLLIHATEGKMEGRIEVTGRRGRRSKQLLDEFQENRGYWKLKGGALSRALWRIPSGRGYGSVVRQTRGRMGLLCGKFLQRKKKNSCTLCATI